MALNYAVQLSMIDRMTAPLKGLTQQWQRTGEAIKQVDKQTASFDRARDVSGRFTNMGGMDSTLSRSANLTVVGAGAVSLGKRISNALQEPLDVAMEFEATLSKVQALTRLDTNDNAQRAKLDALREQAKLLGDTTSFSASQAADAQSFLAMAGFDPDKIMASMPGMLSLAKAGGTELARTADIASNVLSGFGMAANQMTHLSDVMAYTFSSSNVNMEMLGETMKYVAPVASKAGASLEQVAAMSGMLGDVGIQGSMAGTALRAAFIRMADPPKEAAKALKALGVSAKDNRGNMREVTDVMLDLNRSMGKLPDGKRLEYVSSIFGQEAAAAMMELVSNADKLDSRFKEIDRSAGGAADRIAKVMGQNLKGQKDEMLSALEGLYITIGDMLIPIVSKGYGKITGFIRRIQGWINKNKDLAQTIVQLGSQLGGAVMMFGVTAMALASATTAATGLKLGLQSVLPHLSILRVAGGLAFAGLIYGVYQADRVLPILSQHFPMLGNWLEQRLPAAVQRFKNTWSIFKGMQAGDQQFASLSTLKKTQILLQTTFGLTPFILFDQLLDRVQAHWQRLYTQLSAQLPVLRAKLLSTWVGLLARIQPPLQRLKEISQDLFERLGIEVGRVLDKVRALANSGQLQSWLLGLMTLIGSFSFGLLLTGPARVVSVWKWLADVWGQSSGKMAGYLPRLQVAAGTTFDAIKGWLQSNSAHFKKLLAGVVIAVIERLTIWLERLATMARNGQLSAWLDKVAASIQPAIKAISEFASGLWEGVKIIAHFVGHFVEFIGGWKVLAAVFAGGYVIAALSGFLQGLAALVGLIAALFTPVGALIALVVALAAGFRYAYLYWDEMSIKAKVLVSAFLALGTAIIGYVVYAKLAALATWLMGTSLMRSALMTNLARFAMIAYRAVVLGTWLAAYATALGAATVATAAKTAAVTAARWAMIGLRFAVRTLLGPIGLIITAVTAAVALWQNWDQVMGYLKTHFPTIHEFFAVTLPNALNTAIGFLKSGYDWVAKLGDKLANMAAAPFKIGVEVGQEFKKTGSIFEAGRNLGQKWFGGGRAIGGPVEAGKVYRVNEYAPELLVQGNKTFLMASQAGRVVPLRQQPSQLQRSSTNTVSRTDNTRASAVERISNVLRLADKVAERQQSKKIERLNQVSKQTATVRDSNVIKLTERMGRYAKDTLPNDEPAAPPAGHWTVPQLAAQQAGQVQSRSEVNLRIVSDKPVTVEKLKSDAATTVNVNTGRMMAGY